MHAKASSPSRQFPLKPVRVADALKDRVFFIEIDADTQAALDDYLPALRLALPRILEEFYAHLESWPALTTMFRDRSRLAHAREAQARHWMRLFEAKFDEDYADSVRQIGLIHSRIGLNPKWYIDAYAFTLNRLYAHAVHQYHSRFSPEKAQEKTALLMRALNQCVMIDMDMAISVYLEENKRLYNEKLNELARNFEATTGAIVEGVSVASAELKASAESLSSMAGQACAGAQSVAEASAEASANVFAVSAATEQMAVSIAHVSDMAHKSFQAADQAVAETEKSVVTMTELKEAIDTISEVAGMINNIARQTNLLALNATIEAARAGDAGKGFSVVASEVKSLANETADATEDIKTQVAEIIQKSDGAAASLESVKGVIGGSKAVSHETAEAVEQQKAAVDRIAGNIRQASAGTHEISTNIGDISASSEGVSKAASAILDAAKNLEKQGASLRDSVTLFITAIKEGAG